MTQRNQKLAFTLPVVFMFCVYLSAVVYCPPPLAKEIPLLIILASIDTIVPGLFFYAIARKMSENE